MENLFDNPTTLRNLAHFAGRRELLGRIFGLLKNQQSVSLVGPRRIGKTSLLNCLRSPLWQAEYQFDNQHFLFFYLDLQKRSLKDHFDFFDEVYHIIGAYAQAQKYDIADALDKADELENWLTQMHNRELHPVLIMDTFDEIVEYKQTPANVFSFLRSLGTGGNLSYVIASVEGLNAVFSRLFPDNRAPSPFPNIFATLKLSSLQQEEATSMLTTTSALGGLPFTEQEVQQVLHLAGTHPFVLHQVAAVLFEHRRTRAPEEVDYDTLRDEALQNLKGHFEDCWNNLKPQEQKMLIAHVRRRMQGTETKRQPIHTNAGQSGKAKSESFENWDNRIYPEMCQNELFLEYLDETGYLQTVPPELKDALEHFDNPGVLGECALITLLPFIETRMQQQNAHSNTTRGRILLSILNEALENMRGQGRRTDEARDWVYYNILYYRYFNQKLDLTLDIVASRLLISNRQYYRLFPKALEQLWKTLQTMDAHYTPGSKASTLPAPLEPRD